MRMNVILFFLLYHCQTNAWYLRPSEYYGDGQMFHMKEEMMGDCVVSNACYNNPEPLGCFPQGPNTPFCKDYYAPDNPKELNTTFMIYTPTQKNMPQIIDYFNLNQSIMAVKNIDWSLPLTTIVHGWNKPGSWQQDAKNALYKNRYNMNVLLVYWPGGSEKFYPQSVANTRVIGAMIGLILSRIDTLQSSFDMDLSTVAGHSLGGHISGFCANWVQQNHNKLIPFINALDPAGPWFEGYPADVRLDSSDAKFVQAIHCNGEPLAHVPPGFGTHETMGDVDFFVNDGKEQPGCTEWENADGCSHTRCTQLWIQSISLNNKCQQFNAFPGDSNSPDKWNAGHYFDINRSCKEFGIDYRTQGNCNGSYYFGTTAGNDSSIVKYFGSQYQFVFTFAKSYFFNPAGHIDVRFYYGNSADVTATESVSDGSVDMLESTISRIYVNPCTSLSLNGVPTQVGITYRSDRSTTTVMLKSLKINKDNGDSWSINSAQSLEANKECVMPLK